MPLVTTISLLKLVAPPLDEFLAEQLISEFVSVERRFIQRDWEPAQLDGGQFCEIAGRILYHQDSGNLSLDRKFDECAKYIENEDVAHRVSPRKDAIHLMKVLRTVYRFRSDRGAVHISSNYSPNHMDSKLIVENVRWAFAEMLRCFWNGDREAIARTIRELLQFDVPCIGNFEGTILVQRTDLSPEEEVLVLLHYAGDLGFSRKELGRYAQVPPQRVSDSLTKLQDSTLRQVVRLQNGNYRLSDLGSKRVREQLSAKLLLC